MEKCWQREPRERPFFSMIVDEVNNIMCTATYKKEMESIDEAMRRGEIEPMGGSPGSRVHGALDRSAEPSSHLGSAEKRAVAELTASGYARVDISSEEGDQIPLVVIKSKGKSPSQGASTPGYLQLIADDKETADGYVDVTPDITADGYVDVNPDITADGYVDVTPDITAEDYGDTRHFSAGTEKPVHERVNFEDDENFYENPDITGAQKRHSVDDEYYNIPQSFLSVVSKSKSKSTEALSDSTPAKIKPVVPKKPDVSRIKTENKSATTGAKLHLSPTH